jgi:hypothetical protein
LAKNGFGNKANNSMLWSNSSAAFGNRYFIGTWYGDIWQYTLETFSAYLPAIQR